MIDKAYDMACDIIEATVSDVRKDITFDILKIDRSLVKNADKDNSAAIIRGISEIAKSLGIKVVAEGVP